MGSARNLQDAAGVKIHCTEYTTPPTANVPVGPPAIASPFAVHPCGPDSPGT